MRLALLVLLAACHPMVSVGYDMSPSVHGALAPVVGQPMPNTTAGGGNSYAVAVGAHVQAFTLELGIQAHDVTASSFSLADPAAPTGPRYLTGTTSLDFGCSFLTWHHMTLAPHAGPAVGLLFDRMDRAAYDAYGLRFGVTAVAAVHGLAVFADLSQLHVAFDSGPAMGNSTMTGLTIGIGIR